MLGTTRYSTTICGLVFHRNVEQSSMFTVQNMSGLSLLLIVLVASSFMEQAQAAPVPEHGVQPQFTVEVLMINIVG